MATMSRICPYRVPHDETAGDSGSQGEVEENKDDGNEHDEAQVDAAVRENDDGDDDASDNGNSQCSSGDSWEGEPPPLDLNYEALKHVATNFLPRSHGACVDITTLPRGQFHEIRVLLFEDGWSCIGRFTREAEPLAKMESELATIEYVRQHTTIPVPEIFLANYNKNDVVGAPFVLTELLDGSTLNDIW